MLYTDEPLKHDAKWKKLDRRDHILYDAIYMKHSEQVSPQGQKAHQWLPGAQGKGEWW